MVTAKAPASLFTWIGLALMLSGCANLGAVREFAGSSAQLTGYPAVTAHYVSSADRQLADLPSSKRFDATRTNLQALKTVTAQDQATLLKLHAVTTGYMAALADLAGEDAYSISTEMGQVTGALQASQTLNINAEHVQAYGNIVQRVADWAMAARQAKDVQHLVKQNGADMDKLLEAMELATQAYGIVLEQEIQSYEAIAEYREAQWSATLPSDAVLTPERREVISTLLRRSISADKHAQHQALRAQQAAAAGIARVRQGHQAMVKNVDRLTAKDVQALLRKAASELRAIRYSISAL